jgi:hypothetical protein
VKGDGSEIAAFNAEAIALIEDCCSEKATAKLVGRMRRVMRIAEEELPRKTNKTQKIMMKNERRSKLNLQKGFSARQHSSTHLAI